MFAALNNLFSCINIERIDNWGFIEQPIKTENVMEEKQRNKKRRCSRDKKEDMGPREIQPFTCLPSSVIEVAPKPTKGD